MVLEVRSASPLRSTTRSTPPFLRPRLRAQLAQETVVAPDDTFLWDDTAALSSLDTPSGEPSAIVVVRNPGRDAPQGRRHRAGGPVGGNVIGKGPNAVRLDGHPGLSNLALRGEVDAPQSPASHHYTTAIPQADPPFAFLNPGLSINRGEPAPNSPAGGESEAGIGEEVPILQRSDLLDNFLPLDRTALGTAIDQFLEQVEISARSSVVLTSR